MHGQEQRGVELRLAGDLRERLDVVAPAPRLEELRRALLHAACMSSELGGAERLRHLDRSSCARPVHQHREAVETGLPAELPQPGVRLVQPRVDLVDELPHELDRRLRRDLARETRVEEQPADREHHLAVDVVLHVLEGLVADPHRPVALVPREVLELPLPPRASRR